MLDTTRLLDYWPALIRVARRVLPTSDEAVWEDIVGLSIEKAIRGAHRFDNKRGDAYGWLACITRRTAVDVLRATLVHEVELKERGRARVDAGSESHLTSVTVRDAVGKLPPFLAKYGRARLSGLGIIEAGAQAGIPRSTASRREDELRAQLGVLLR